MIVLSYQISNKHKKCTKLEPLKSPCHCHFCAFPVDNSSPLVIPSSLNNLPFAKMVLNHLVRTKIRNIEDHHSCWVDYCFFLANMISVFQKRTRDLLLMIRKSWKELLRVRKYMHELLGCVVNRSRFGSPVLKLVIDIWCLCPWAERGTNGAGHRRGKRGPG